jgi:signal transduction histidine kinase
MVAEMVTAGCWLVAAAMLVTEPASRRLAAPTAVVGAALALAATATSAAWAAAVAGFGWLLAGLPDGRLATPLRRRLSGGVLVVGPAVGFWSASAGVAVAAIGVLAGAVLAAARYPSTGLNGGRRMLWVLWGTTVAAFLALATWPLSVLLGWSPIPVLALAAVPVGLVATVRPVTNRWVEPMLAATVALFTAAALAAAAGALVVLASGRFPEGREWAWLGASMGAAALVALCYPAARRAAIDRLNRLVYEVGRSPAEALAVFPSRMTRAVPLEELLLQLAELLRSAWRLTAAEVWTGSDGRLELAAADPPLPSRAVSLSREEVAVVARAGVSGGSWAMVWLASVVDGRDPERLRMAPLVHSGLLVGLLVCERGPERDPLTPADDALLAEVARQVALVLRNNALDSALQASLAELRTANEELRRSRARLVAAADGERRRLERDLHDGAQQHLMVLAVKLGLARETWAGDDSRALVDELQADVRQAIAELRALAHGIYPPLLITGGLAEALPAAVAQLEPPATVDVTDLPRYSPEVEAAVYFCCLEAVQNATKHAGPAARIWLHAGVDGGTLWFEVRDDGAGFDLRELRDRHGLDNMRDRIGAQGGTLAITSAPGRGTTVRGELPLP